MPLTTEPVTRAPAYVWALFGRVTVLELVIEEADSALFSKAIAEIGGKMSVRRAVTAAAKRKDAAITTKAVIGAQEQN
jgi:hypothetical protein